jgi:Domain of unknown function (DUF4159)/Aerotolerance regulator N-terminal
MLGLPLAFSLPLVLSALVVLPALYWLLRLTPPPPRRVTLPTLPIIRDLDREEETPAQTPWWLLLLRLLAAAAIILAMAGPIWNPDRDAQGGRGPMLLMLDNGWSAALDWKARVARAEALIETAALAGRPVVVRGTADDAGEWAPGTAQAAQERLRALQPQPFAVDRRKHEASLAEFATRFQDGNILWLTDMISQLDDAQTLASLPATVRDRLTILAPETPKVIGLAGAENGVSDLGVRVLRTAREAGQGGTLRALDSRGRQLGEAGYLFASGETTATARFEMPLELRNDVARIEAVQDTSAGSVLLVDGRERRQRVGLISGESADTAQPLLSPTNFVAKALLPFADIREAPRGHPDPVGRLLEDGATVLVMNDIGTLGGTTLRRLTDFVEGGGVLIRFASRRVAPPTDPLLPVRLRRSERIMGGALSWDTPRRLAPFPTGSPFEGVAVAADVTVSQQVLAEPDSALAARSWAILEDGTPLITGDRRGKGVVALYHVTAEPGWSSLPLSAIFVETLRRLTTLSALRRDGETSGAEGAASTLALPALRQLDGFGVFRAPAATTEPVRASYNGIANLKHPAGFYGVLDAPMAINVLTRDSKLLPLGVNGLTVRTLEAQRSVDLRGVFLTLALLLFLVDALAMLFLTGALSKLGLSRLRPSGSVARSLLAGLALAMLMPVSTEAQQAPAVAPTPIPRQRPLQDYKLAEIESALSTRLAFVITGDAQADEASRLGLAGLSRAMSTRTALDPADPIGLDITKDELAFYPLLYWPIVASRSMPNEATLRRIEAYMKGGGTLLVDTRDALNDRGGGVLTPEARRLREIFAGMDIPALEPVPKDHVITKTFYLLDGIVGRYTSGRTYIEVLERGRDADRSRPAQAGDRVSPIIITGNDLAAAWAVDRNGQPRYALVPGDGRQREMAMRSGVNIVMYALTGNYKADQVHVPALLERLGQ